MRKIRRLRFIGFIITLATIFGLLSVFGSTVAFAAEDDTSYLGETFAESKALSNTAKGATLQFAFSITVKYDASFENFSGKVRGVYFHTWSTTSLSSLGFGNDGITFGWTTNQNSFCVKSSSLVQF